MSTDLCINKFDTTVAAILFYLYIRLSTLPVTQTVSTNLVTYMSLLLLCGINDKLWYDCQ